MEKEDLPPKTVKAQLVRLDDNLKQIERTQFAGIQRAPGSLPVLEAFQLFLENERKIAQQRLLMVTAIAIIAILVSVASAGLYIRHTLRNADARTDSLAHTTAEIQHSLGSISQRQQTAEERLVQAARHLAAQRQTLAEQAAQLSEQQQAVLNEREERASEVIRLREQVESLLTSQASIQQMLTAAPARPTVLSPPQPAIRPDTIGPARRREEPAQDPAAIQYRVVTLAPEGRAGVRWMLPTAANAQE